MDAVTKEILKVLETMNRRFKLVETRLDRLENHVFTPAENTRFYEEMVVSLRDDWAEKV